jgi:peptidoglycan/LPS O-acetylase OafA/YrhL
MSSLFVGAMMFVNRKAGLIYSCYEKDYNIYLPYIYHTLLWIIGSGLIVFIILAPLVTRGKWLMPFLGLLLISQVTFFCYASNSDFYPYFQSFISVIPTIIAIFLVIYIGRLEAAARTSPPTPPQGGDADPQAQPDGA